MKKFRNVSALLLVLAFIVTMLQIPIKSVQAAENSNIVYVKIRYDRADKNYDGWNVWAWEKGKDGRQVNFIGEDEQGKFAVVETTKEAQQLSFIIRKGDWVEKATGDENVDLANGDVETKITQGSGEATRVDNPLNRNFSTVKLNLHYYRLDQNYDSWDVWSWINNSDSAGYAFNKQDDFGKLAEITKTNVQKSKAVSFIIRQGGNSWTSKDGDKDRSVDLAYANNNGEINAYILQGDEKVYTNPSEPIKNPQITSLKIDSITEMSFKLNAKLLTTDGIVVKENGIVTDSSLYSVNVGQSAIDGLIKFKNPINLLSTYTLEIPKFSSANSSFGKIYGSKEFDDLFGYKGELGAIYNPNETRFILWAPTATKVRVALYGNDGRKFNPAEKVVDMEKGEKGTWAIEENGDLDGVYYNYLVTIDGKENEVTDPYAKAVGVNGKRGMVVNLNSTNPVGWSEDKRPELENPTDAMIYEMHIRDFSIDPNSGVTLEYRGKYKGVWQDKTTIPGTDVKTGVAHLKELGINTVQLMPAFDHRSIDETRLNTPQFNWGYDPQNYNVPEGSYSSDPYDGKIRIKEFKELVQELHKQGIKVIMDVVYNHTGTTTDSLFNLAVPDYYYRQNAAGGFSNGSGTGNETASERSMVRRLIVDSVKYWVQEYHIDGFRFDLMAIHDIDTMKEIRSELDKIDKKIIVYGEGWAGGDVALPKEQQSLKANATKFGELQIGMFSDDFRDGIKGNVFDDKSGGFINGGIGFEDSIKFGIVASTKHDGIDYSKVNYSKEPWANEPYQTITYASCHDNMTLWDKLQTVSPNKSEREIEAMNKVSAALVFTSQGMPFIQAGEEFARTKVNKDGTFNGNSYNAPDSVNKLDWERVKEYQDLYNYYRGLINLRSSHKAFRMSNTKDIQENLKFLQEGKDFKGDNIVAYTLNGNAVGDSWNKIAVIFNSNNKTIEVTLPSKGWTVVVNENKAGIEKLEEYKGATVIVPANSAYVLVDSASYASK
ncbi:MAG: pullulanase, type I [Clostridium sp. Maddingley MBC34-26]|nr:type I pullulanase [Clostridium sp. LS]EKQ57293.1 MAG: pullulanase, type I [Clostridium sp. Maddingley MBC34-26]